MKANAGNGSMQQQECLNCILQSIVAPDCVTKVGANIKTAYHSLTQFLYYLNIRNSVCSIFYTMKVLKSI
ncbi:hypothetical protein D3H65_02445 [Paraflavitalea soli]|uniref:Uncharacterized protein n=1 Tax=Paraflavitalea soli TaxID=2315862 RepID=A0A3B7MMP9_9BACT|nr:hypothetical protein D3H65_02445 [Paraflavitalea soli]